MSKKSVPDAWDDDWEVQADVSNMLLVLVAGVC